MANSPGGTTPSFEQKMRELREAYEKTLPEKTERIKEMWMSLRTLQRLPPDLLLPFREIVHKLAGSGATYGFSALSSIMQRLEQKLDQLKEFPEDTQRFIVDIDSLVRYMDSVIRLEDTKTDHDGLTDQKMPRPDTPKLLFVCEPGSPLRRLPEQIRHFGWDVIPCDYAQMNERLTLYRPEVVLFHETPEQPCPAPASLDMVPAPVVFNLHPKPDLCSRAAAFRKGIREVLTVQIDVAELVDRLDGVFFQPSEAAYRVLIVDDDDDVAMYHREVLEQARMEIRLAKTAQEVQDTLAEFKPDVILMDLHLPEFNGIELSAAIRQDQSLKEVPIVFASVAQDLTSHLGAIRAGGDDFLMKPIQPSFLVASLESRARRGRELRELLHFDGLTGMLNHRTTEELMQQAVARADRTDGELVVVMIDLDHFKQVNDTYGHVTGDRVLVNFSRFLRGRMRKSDVVGRYGGEEFMLVLVDTGLATARAVIESLRVSFASVNHSNNDTPLNVTFSAGLAVYPTFSTPVELTHASDAALYEAKHRGRNCSVVATHDMLKSRPPNG